MPLSSDRSIDRFDLLARESGFSVDAIESLWRSLVRGGGRMARFDHREFGGAGQWMEGGMLMVADPADRDLKRRIAKLCDDVSEWVSHDAVESASQPSRGTMGSANDDRHPGAFDGSLADRRRHGRFDGP